MGIVLISWSVWRISCYSQLRLANIHRREIVYHNHKSTCLDDGYINFRSSECLGTSMAKLGTFKAKTWNHCLQYFNFLWFRYTEDIKTTIYFRVHMHLRDSTMKSLTNWCVKKLERLSNYFWHPMANCNIFTSALWGIYIQRCYKSLFLSPPKLSLLSLNNLINPTLQPGERRKVTSHEPNRIRHS